MSSIDISLSLTELMSRLGLDDERFVDRKQMRRLLELASRPGTDSPSRSRYYHVHEIAGALAAIELLKEQWQYHSGKLDAKTVTLRRACEQLWRFGIEYPLALDVLAWDPSTQGYVFHFDGFLVDASTGQARIEGLLSALTGAKATQDALDWARIAMRRSARAEPVMLRKARHAIESTTPTIVLD